MLSFKAGKLAAHFSQWQSLTSDPEILETVSGCKIEFDTIPSFNKVMVHAVLSETQTKSVDTEVSNLLRKQAIEACDHEAGEYISPIFTRSKKDGSHRMTLNLKSLNKHIMDVAWLLGLMTSSFPGVMYGALHLVRSVRADLHGTTLSHAITAYDRHTT